MQGQRRIERILKGIPTIEGAGVRLSRAFGYRHVPALDPFLLLDDFSSAKPGDYVKGFPWHPHRGIETITCVLRGKVAHGDSMGNEGVIGEGDIQWMTAGSGIIHQEMPFGDRSGHLLGFQLWANLPASHKMMDPRYRGLEAREIPLVTGAGGEKVRVIAGELDGVVGPVREIVTGPEYFDVSISPDGAFSHPEPAGRTVFAYVFEGKGFFDDRRDPYSVEVEGGRYFDLEREAVVGPGNVVLYGDGEGVAITAGPQGVRFLLVSGKPIGEPVAWYGPIVMNTQEELRVAFQEYQDGTFIRHAGRQAGSGPEKVK
ncbi:MAG TPA: pirin family protein [Methanomicrobiales archaeon]|nr:pirin family protein [Methanomicrobiales archaeon]